MLRELHIAVEGPDDELVAERVARAAGFSLIVPVQKAGGKKQLIKKLPSYNHAAKWSFWFVLMDLDSPDRCPGSYRSELLPEPSQGMCFRLAVPEMESWLLADAEGIADFLGISRDLVPHEPDRLTNAKEEMIRLANRSRNRQLRADMVRENPLGRGPAYRSRINEFVTTRWNVEAARKRSPSLDRCIRALNRMLEIQL